jgi:glycogen debranching enzyme
MSTESTARVSDFISDSAEAALLVGETGPASKPRYTLKYDDAFVVVDNHGDIGASAGGADGLFHSDTRFLSLLELLVDARQPVLLSVNASDDSTLLTIELTNPDIIYDGNIVLQQHALHIMRTIYLWQNEAYQRFGVRNYGDVAVDIVFTVNFDNDFADLFEVRGARRARRGVLTRSVDGPGEATLTYQGLDGKRRTTRLVFDPPPAALSVRAATYRLHIEPHGHAPIFLTASCNRPREFRATSFLRGLLHVHRERQRENRGCTTIVTSNHIFNEVLCRSMADLHMLITNTPQGPYPYAGIPWFSTTFGRDGLITAMQMLWFDPNVAHGVLRRLACYQATAEDPFADAEPGKILHEMRGGEMASLKEIPFGLYYGSVDATPLFVLLAGMYAERTGDDRTFSELWPHVAAALQWIDGTGDPDRDGFVEYRRAGELGLANQGWKDSFDAVFHRNGRLAEGAIALAEVQGYVFAAKKIVARCARRIGRNEEALALERQAASLAERFETAFWCPELETYALALDGAKEPCRVRSSNAGQLLFTGIADPSRAALVAANLLRPRSFSGWGIRTIANGESRYNPLSYHNGSIWPHDNALIALGFARYGIKRAAERVFTGLFDAATYMDLRRLPELFCGLQRQHGRGPTLYPVACAPQAWASATPFTLLEAALGLEFDAGTSEIRLRNPRLPEFLDEVMLRDLRLGEASIDLNIRRHNEDVSVDIPRRQGRVQISVVFSR